MQKSPPSITFLSFLQSHFPITLQNCDSARFLCCYRPGNTHQTQPFQQQFVQLALLHRDCRKPERTLFHFLPKWIHFPSNGAFHLSSFLQLATILPQAPVTSPPLPAHSSEEAPLPRNRNTHGTHRHLCKHLTQTIPELLIFIPAQKWSQSPTDFPRVM